MYAGQYAIPPFDTTLAVSIEKLLKALHCCYLKIHRLPKIEKYTQRT